MAHTPGPWTVGEWREPFSITDSRVIRCGDKINDVTAFVTDSQLDHEANARLIAAAPDLLEALQAFLGEHNGVYGVSATTTNIDRARAAIKKATGE